MKRWQRYGFTTASIVVTLTGAVYFWMKHLLQNDDPFAVVNHPLQPAMLDAHLLAAPFFLVLFGIIFAAHVDGRIGRPIPNRRSGLVALVTVAIMTASGYLLQTVTSDGARQAMLVVHLASGALFAVAYVVHLFISARIWRVQRRLRATAVP